MKRPILLILPFLLITSVQAVGSKTIGYVDMQQVIEKSKLGQQAQRTLRKKFKGKQQELAKEQQSIRQLQETLDKDKVLMSKEELSKRTAAIRKRRKTFQQQVAKFQKELAQEETRLANRVLEPAPAIIAAVARDKRVSVVFERRQSGLLYIDKGLDLTAEVVKRLDAKK